MHSKKMLEFKKNRLNKEIGNRDQVILPESFDASSVWQSVSLISNLLKNNNKILKGAGSIQSQGDIASFRSFKS